MFDLRLIKADVLKLRRRRGLLALAFLVTVGAAVLIYTITALRHGSNPIKYGPAGGLKHYRDSIGFLNSMVLVVAALVGATAGAADIESGVFRDLAATGRSRVALFASRMFAGWAVVLTVVAAVAAVTAVAASVLAGPLPAPGATAVLNGTVSLLLAGALGTAVAVGLAAVVGSRGPVIAVLVGFELAVLPILSVLKLLGDARQAIPTNALERVAGTLPSGGVQMTLLTAVLVLVAWLAVPFIAGAWRTRTQEI
jgi:hypothetical protein